MLIFSLFVFCVFWSGFDSSVPGAVISSPEVIGVDDDLVRSLSPAHLPVHSAHADAYNNDEYEDDIAASDLPPEVHSVHADAYDNEYQDDIVASNLPPGDILHCEISISSLIHFGWLFLSDFFIFFFHFLFSCC